LSPRWAVSLVVAFCLLCVAGCPGRPSHDEPRHYGPKVNLRDFMQNTANYKGRIITLALQVDEVIDRGQGKSLRDYVGREVKFTTTASQGERLNVVIKIPEGVSVPEVGQSEEVSITFLCARGILRQGNEAKIVEKPMP
jgi:hypothetical protein